MATYLERDVRQLFLLVGGVEAGLIECKWTEIPDASDAKNVMKLIDIIETKKPSTLGKVTGYVFSRSPSAFPITERMQCIKLFSLPLAT